jgi:hypothetical protein
MQGDLLLTPMGNPSHKQLYNGELWEHPANDFSAPVGSAQPMGKGSNSSSAEANYNRGVFFQNLEETLANDASDAGAPHRRQSFDVRRVAGGFANPRRCSHYARMNAWHLD